MTTIYKYPTNQITAAQARAPVEDLAVPILQQIYNKIVRAVCVGRTSMTYNEGVFGETYFLDNKNSRCVLVAHVMDALSYDGYIVKVLHEPDHSSPCLLVEWGGEGR